MRKLTTIIALMSIWRCVYAQDLHFSQFQSAPIHMNPAMTGIIHDGEVVTLHYRNQWQPVLGSDGAFKTLSATFEQRLNNKAVDFFGWGASLWQDKAGAITQTEGKAAISYARMMGRSNKGQHYLIAGAQTGFVHRIIDISDRRWLNQYDGNGGFDPSKPASVVDFPIKVLPDIGAGLAWYSLYETGTYFTAGIGLHHLNRPEVSALQQSLLSNQYRRFTIHASANLSLGNSLWIMPSGQFVVQGPSRQILPGAALKFVLDNVDYKAIQAGGWLRMVDRLDQGLMNDAFIAFVRVDWMQFNLGFSYDVNVSTLRQANASNNSIEVTLGYRFGNDYKNLEIKNRKKKMGYAPRYY